MRTYTHGAIGYALYVNGSRRERRLAALGGILPDAIVGLGFVFHVAEPWTTLPIVAQLHALLHHSPLHTLTIALHSFLIVAPLLLLSWWLRHAATPLFAGMLAHAVVDLLTHRTWAYNHLFPVPLAPVRGIVSYTDPAFTVIEHVGLVLLVAWLVARRRRAVPVAPAGGTAA